MKKGTLELAVGLFMLVGIICLGYLSIKLGKMELMGGDSYPLYAEFDSVSGLKQGAFVEIAGVEVGRVDTIVFLPAKGMARVNLRINAGIKLQDDVIAAVRTKGIIGDKFLKLKPGGSERTLAPGGRIRETESSVDIEELLSKYIHGKVE
jgi:phospholipid/cholesterol/gamma-HCH transport system substrate-binding protein